MAYGRRKKGGSALMALARRRRLKAAKDKEGTLDPLVIKPALSRLRTGAVSKRKKGGQTLMGLAKRRKKPAAKKPAAKKPVKKPASSQSSRFGSRIPVESRSPKTAAQKNAANRAKKRETLLKEQQKLRGKSAGMKYGSEYKGIPGISKKQQEDMARSMEYGSGGGLIKAGIAAGLAAAGLKGHQLYKAKKAVDLASGKTGGVMADIGATRAASAASRTSGLGKPALKKKSALSGLLKFFRKGKPKSAFDKLKKTQRRYPK